MTDTGPNDERTQARELAIKLLYVMDISGAAAAEAQSSELFVLEQVPRPARELALELFRGVRDNLAQTDKALQEAAINWQLSRMPYLDRAILRLGAYELMHQHDVPPRVTINEAVELAKKYSTEKSGAFVNGVLDKIFQTSCPEKV
ncbi:MAG: transcription antitermination factor NusB [Planctomycetes bacterium]|nr:transcription antitermination factor NusB [Planctomycetota bacterium]